MIEIKNMPAEYSAEYSAGMFFHALIVSRDCAAFSLFRMPKAA